MKAVKWYLLEIANLLWALFYIVFVLPVLVQLENLGIRQMDDPE